MLKVTELTKIENGSVRGPMSPLLFVKEFMTKAKQPQALKVWRVDADLRFRDGGETGTADLLLALTVMGDLVLLIDFGANGRGVGVKWRDGELAIFDEWRHDEEFYAPPSDEDLKRVLDGIDAAAELTAIRGQLKEGA